MKFKKPILIGLILSTPLVAFASNKQVSITNKQINLTPINLELKEEDNLKHINHLRTEGAISDYEAEILIKNESVRDPSKKNTNKPTNTTKNDILSPQNVEAISANTSNNIELNIFENNSLIKLSLPSFIELKKSNIIEIDSGWQMILQVPKGSKININNLPEKPKYFNDIDVNKFNDLTYIISIKINKNFKANKPIINKVNYLTLNFNIKDINKKKRNKFNIPFLRKFKKRHPIYTQSGSAVAPPVGDIASGSVVLKNRGFIQLEGPNISLTLNDASAKDALMRLSKIGGYGLVITSNDDKNGETKIGPKVTLSFLDEDYSVAFNSILLASGMQAKRNNNLIFIGENVLGKSFGPQLSKVYRLNQTSASAAADYLATLGASITKVDTVASTGSGKTDSTDNGVKYIDSYSASTGPLNGLIGTTDSRLQTITLVGPSELILIAEKYLKQLDLRQRQVALTVKILDVEITDNDSINTDLAFRTGSTFIVNEKGKLFSAFGNYIPGSLSSGGPAEQRAFTESTTIDNEGKSTTTQSFTKALANNVVPNPGFQYTANQLYNFLTAQMRSTSTKVLANPTLILSESSEQIKGGASVVGSIGGGVSSIGRPFANESFITLGTNVITDYATSTSSEGGATTCKASFSTAGLTFGARINKIDDNGYVTFSLSPKFTSISEIVDIPNCGPINILSVRRLDTGKLRVKDSQTLILTGVISEIDSETISKTPILGDIPILGRLFKSTAGSKRKSELVILVTPKIINDTEQDNFKLGYEATNNTKDILSKNND